MNDISGIVNALKSASVNAVEDNKNTSIITGTVTSINPLSIFIDQKFVLDENQLVLSRNVTDYTINYQVSQNAEMQSDNAHQKTETQSGNANENIKTQSDNYNSHVGTKSCNVLNSLKIGEIVIMISMLGGQKFLVLDRLKEQ